jgi:hypothetical protein
MIISNLIGGLGNQMFQYAAAKSLSVKYNTPLLLDIGGFRNYTLHNGFELNRVFNISAEIASQAEKNQVLGIYSNESIRKLVKRLKFRKLIPSFFVLEPSFKYWPKINNVPYDCYLEGYWQSDKYFKEIEGVIRSEFNFQIPLSDENRYLASIIDNSNSISLHIRRGDYVKNFKTLSTHGLCSIEYYNSAIRYVLSKVQSPYFFIFSDDINWAKENIKLDFPCLFINNNFGENSYVDMQLMSMCKHNIIANSSFSWWGAWLNKNESKVVVAPQKWFVNNLEIDDLFPKDWVAIQG